MRGADNPVLQPKPIDFDRREGIEKIILTAKKYSGSRKEGKTAIVGPKEIDYGLGRMYQTFSELEGLPYEYMVFKELEEAKDWLGV